MELSRIAELLQPFLTAPLAEPQLEYISTYVDMLLRWNARINLTAVRRPEEIVTRHFGESLFAARQMLPDYERTTTEAAHLIDFGSGSGFPGLPIKIWRSDLRVTLIESNQKRATFLREVTRALALTNVTVFGERAESYRGDAAHLVTLRAVEHFEKSLTAAASLVGPDGRIALLIGRAQCAKARDLQSRYSWDEPMAIPLSASRVLLVGSKMDEPS